MLGMNHEKPTSRTNEHYERVAAFLSSAIRGIAVGLP
jgi:hypothetical protein